MSVVEGLSELPADLRRRPTAAAYLAASVAAMAAVPVAIYGGNIAPAALLSLVALATLTNADRTLEESP